MNKLDDVTDDETLEKPILKDLQDPEQEGPQDEGNTVYYAFLFMGFCALLHWSCILNCFDFMAAYVKLPFIYPKTFCVDGKLLTSLYISIREQRSCRRIISVVADNRRSLYILG